MQTPLSLVRGIHSHLVQVARASRQQGKAPAKKTMTRIAAASDILNPARANARKRKSLAKLAANMATATTM